LRPTRDGLLKISALDANSYARALPLAMIDSDNLRTASLYINNQLLSRGLLRDGQNIDFADPDAGEGLQGTMGKIMGVVNDLILRRDVSCLYILCYT
jgi:hypothetical protein